MQRRRSISLIKKIARTEDEIAIWKEELRKVDQDLDKSLEELRKERKSLEQQ